MRVLLVGSGGREHALAWKLRQEAEVIAAPGNPGIALIVECVPVTAQDFDGLLETVRNRQIDLVVCGPEDPLVNGLGDFLRSHSVPVYGPSQAGSALEASKAFSKEVMADAGIPTAGFGTFTDTAAALEFARNAYAAGRQLAVKASGNALGKGVVVASTLHEAEAAIVQMLADKVFGDAGSTVVLEDRLDGREFSLLTIIGDHNYVSLPVAQDYKRIYDNDEGPNTGGMGTYSPTAWVSDELVKEAERVMVEPLIAELKRRGIAYRGTLFSGVMVVDNKPWCLEYNVRFGDPETQSVMRRLGSGFAQALFDAATGQLIQPPEVLNNAVVSVVVSGPDYPAKSSKGVPIHLGPMPDCVEVFHAGTAMTNGQLVTNGGRVVCVSAVADTITGARATAYKAAAQVQFEGAHYRTDIAAKD